MFLSWKELTAIEQDTTAKYPEYLPLIKKTARRYRDIEDAEQEAWLCYCEAVNDYDPAKCRYFASYLRQKLRWHFKKLIRQKHRLLRVQTTLCQQQTQTILQTAAQDNLTDFSEISINKLPPRTRTAVSLMLKGYTLSDTARIMQVKPQTVAGLIKRALTAHKNASQPV